MAFTETDHIVIVVADIEAGIETWREQLGMTLSHRASVPEAGIHQAFFLLPDNTFIELIAPANRPHRWRDAQDPASPRRQDEGRQ